LEEVRDGVVGNCFCGTFSLGTTLFELRCWNCVVRTSLLELRCWKSRRHSRSIRQRHSLKTFVRRAFWAFHCYPSRNPTHSVCLSVSYSSINQERVGQMGWKKSLQLLRELRCWNCVVETVREAPNNSHSISRYSFL
jgi:hypothetical protein